MDKAAIIKDKVTTSQIIKILSKSKKLHNFVVWQPIYFSSIVKGTPIKSIEIKPQIGPPHPKLGEILPLLISIARFNKDLHINITMGVSDKEEKEINKLLYGTKPAEILDIVFDSLHFKHIFVNIGEPDGYEDMTDATYRGLIQRWRNYVISNLLEL